MENKREYLLVDDDREIYFDLGEGKEIQIINLESMLDSVIDSYRAYGLDVEELIDNIKNDTGIDVRIGE